MRVSGCESACWQDSNRVKDSEQSAGNSLMIARAIEAHNLLNVNKD